MNFPVYSLNSILYLFLFCVTASGRSDHNILGLGTSYRVGDSVRVTVRGSGAGIELNDTSEYTSPME